MALRFDNPDEVIRQGFAQYKNFIPAGAPKVVEDKLAGIDSYGKLVDTLKTEGKLPDDLAHDVASTTVYGLLEKFGVDPAEWKFTVSPVESGKVKYGAEEYNEARRFLGSWTAVAELALFMGSIAAMVTAVTGVFLAGSILRSITSALRFGRGWEQIAQLLKIETLKSIKWLSIPAAITAISTAWAYFANTQITATGDLETYVKQGVARGEEKIREAEARTAGVAGGTTFKFIPTERIIIRMTDTTKPKLYTGTLFSAPLSKAEAFDRHVDDMITDLDDLQNDAKLNLTKWYSTMPGRMSWSISIQLNPFDEWGTKQTGTWLVLQLFYRRVAGAGVPLDTILLGPVDPIKYMPTSQSVKQVEKQLTQELKTQTIKELELPRTPLSIVDKDGAIVPLPPALTGVAAPIQTPAAPTAPVFDEITMAALRAGILEGATFQYQGRWFRLDPGGAVTVQGPEAAIVAPFVRPTAAAPVPVASPVSAPPKPAPALSAGERQICATANLFEYYTLRLGNMKPLSERAQSYQDFGLGSRSEYVGSESQNIRLLRKLKDQIPCP